MKLSKTARFFDIPADLNSREVLKKISREFSLLSSRPRRVRSLYFDTFDWRLFRKDFVLVRSDGEFQLYQAGNAMPTLTCPMEGEPRFWQEFPGGPLRETLRDIAGLRALILVGEMGASALDARVLNKDEKTVARARIEEARTLNGDKVVQRVRTINIQPVRGYETKARSLSAYLQRIGFVPAARTAFETAVEGSGRRPGDYSSKFEAELEGDMTAQQAAAVIFVDLARTIERNVDGIQQDIDIEFLHDFRVAIRRTRSALSLMVDVIPREISREFRDRFAEAGRATNRLRDLDVYLLRQDEYRQAVEPHLRDALTPMLDLLAEDRKREHAAVAAMLATNQVPHLLRDWRKVIQAFNTQEMEAPRSRVPVSQLSRRLIKKHYRRVLRDGGKIGAESPDASLHELRIKCKKLRYLLEFYASLFPADEMAVLVKQLKRLQDNLGDFNDLSVQRADLEAFLASAPEGVPVSTGAAVGELMADLSRRQAGVRSHFARTFKTFASAANIARYQKLVDG